MKTMFLAGILAVVAGAGSANRPATKAAIVWAVGEGPAFDEERAFDISGTVEESGLDELTLGREGLPPAVLDVRSNTVVFLDGKRSNARLLNEGDRVRAKFQLDGEAVVAVRIDATSRKQQELGVGGSGLDEEPQSEGERMDEGARNNTAPPEAAADEAQNEVPERTW